MEMEETKIGRLAHKIEKLKTLGERTPGVEFMRSEVFSGDHGLAVIEHAPFGVIGAITPVTHSLPTITGNAVNMIAGGNTLVVNPHPSGKRVAVEGVRRFNQAIYRDLGIDNLISRHRRADVGNRRRALFKHHGIKLICVTGGPAVAKAAMQSSKRAIVAGPGNPPVVVDETADLARAAQAMIRGAAYDNNLLCIAEKEVFVVESVMDALLAEMERAGAVRLERPRNRRPDQGGHRHGRRRRTPARRGGQGFHRTGRRRSWPRPPASRCRPRPSWCSAKRTKRNPFVPVEQMMPFLPFVRVRNVDEAIAKAKKYEHGFRHTSIIHSNNVRNMTKMGRALDTTLFVKNGPCMASLGLGGEGYLSFSIATPTGEGVTTPLTFTRERRCSLIDDLRILGK